MKPRHPSHPYLFVAPTVLVLFLFFVYPLVIALWNSFYSWDLLTPPRYVGVSNYTTIAESGELAAVAWRTLSFGAVVVLASSALGLGLAVALNRRGRVYAFVRGAVFSAYVVSWVAVALLWMWILDGEAGLVTRIFRAVGIPTMNWLGDPKSALWAIAVVTVWKITGYAMVVYLAGLQAIPNAWLEAAALDGAGPWQRFKEVIWPSLKPTTAFVSTTGLIMSFQAFDVIRVMTQGGPARSTTLFVYAIYEDVFQNLRVGRASAWVIVFFLILMACSAFTLRSFGARRRSEGAT